MTEEEQAAFDALKAEKDKLANNNAKLTDELKEERDAKRALESTAEERAEEARKAAEDKARAENNIDELEKTWKEKQEAAEARAYDAESKYETTLIENAMNKAITSAGIAPEYANAAALLIKNDTFPEIGDDGSVSVDGKSLTDHVKAWAESDAGKPYISNGNGGGGAGGGQGGEGGGRQSDSKGDMGGTKAERQAALAAKYPELQSTD